MSFSISKQKQIIVATSGGGGGGGGFVPFSDISTGNLDVSGNLRVFGRSVLKDVVASNVDVSEYYYARGQAINNSFFPGLTRSSAVEQLTGFTRRDVSAAFPIGTYRYTSVLYSPELNIFSALPFVGGTVPVYSYDSVNWFSGDNSGSTTSGFYKGAYGLTSAGVPTFVYVGNLTNSGINFGSSFKSTSFAYSTNGITYSTFANWTDSSGNNLNPLYVMFNDTSKLFIGISPDVSSGTGTIRFFQSTDGINWTLRSSLANQVISWGRCLAWSPELGIYLFASNGNGIYRSSDAINWTQVATPATVQNAIGTGLFNDPTDIIWCSELGVFFLVSFAQGACYSKDGVTWLPTNLNTFLGGDRPAAPAWCNQLRAMYVSTTEQGASNCGWFSTDISNWTRAKYTSGGNTTNASSWFPCWSREQGVLVTGSWTFAGSGNTTAPVLVGGQSGKVPTQSNLFDSSLNNLANNGLWSFQSFGRGAPVLRSGTHTIQPGQNWIIATGASTVTLPTASQWTGREIMFLTRTAAAITSASANVVDKTGTSTSTIVGATAGGWATLVSDGSNWIIVQTNL